MKIICFSSYFQRFITQLALIAYFFLLNKAIFEALASIFLAQENISYQGSYHWRDHQTLSGFQKNPGFGFWSLNSAIFQRIISCEFESSHSTSIVWNSFQGFWRWKIPRLLYSEFEGIFPETKRFWVKEKTGLEGTCCSFEEILCSSLCKFSYDRILFLNRWRKLSIFGKLTSSPMLDTST